LFFYMFWPLNIWVPCKFSCKGIQWILYGCSGDITEILWIQNSCCCCSYWCDCEVVIVYWFHNHYYYYYSYIYIYYLLSTIVYLKYNIHIPRVYLSNTLFGVSTHLVHLGNVWVYGGYYNYRK
jgi:hypothetical protein